MTSPRYGQAATQSPVVIDLSDSDEATQQEVNDNRLTKAIEYLSQEGGDDSTVTFMNRVDRIDKGLLQLLPQQDSHFDTSLYQRLQAMIRDVRCEFENAVQTESPMRESDDELPEHNTASAVRALRRIQKVVGGPKATSSKPMHRGDDKAPHEQEFKYGGPSNQVETWHKDFPSFLPFPETMQMAHWESLKIDFDLSETGKQLKADGKVVETNIPFNHPALAQYKNLNPYNSGSRFKLPVASKRVQTCIKTRGDLKKLTEVVDAFNKGDREKEIAKDYAPRVFLNKLSVSTSHTTPSTTPSTIPSKIPSKIRQAVNTTPIKTPIRAYTPSTRTSKVPSPQTPKDQITQHIPDEVDSTDEKDSEEDAPLPQIPEKVPTPQRRPAAQQSRTSAVSRRLERERQDALKKSPRRQSGISTALKSQETVIEKRTPGRPPKVTAPVLVEDPMSESEHTTDSVPESSPHKRKHNTGDSTYTPETKRTKGTNGQAVKHSFIKKVTKTPDKTVSFVSSENPAVKVTKKTEVTSVTTVPNKSPSKAAAAGKQTRTLKEKRVYEEKVSDGEYERRMAEMRKDKEGPPAKGSTRSGRTFKN